MSHTPGPWRAQPADDRHDPDIVGIYAGPLPTPDDPDRKPIAEVYCHPGDEHGESNARLIAAAPDLLVALEKATFELNAIRARDGAPQQIDWYRGQPMQNNACDPDWWNELTEMCWAALDKAKARPAED